MSEPRIEHDLSTLATLRPAPDQFEDEWDAEARADVLTDILRGRSRVSTTRSRRWQLLGAFAACSVAAAVMAGVLLPSGAPGGPDRAAAAALDRLAVTAGLAGGSVGPHQFAYVREDSEQTVAAGDPVPPGYTRVGNAQRETTEQWTAPNGRLWFYRALGRTQPCLSTTEQTAAPGEYEDMSAAQLDALPTDPGGLAAYIDGHPSGDNRGATNRYTAVTDLVRSGLAAPALRAAALRVLARTHGIRVDTQARDDAGRPAIRVDKSFNGGVDSVFFDADTSRVLEERTTQGRWFYRSIVRESKVVGAIPAGLPRCNQR